MTILIAGGCGFIGLALSERLLADGAAVVAFDRNPPPAAAARRFADLPGTWTAVAGDVRDPDALARACRDHGVRQAFYGAALTSGADRECDHPEQVVAVNLLGLINLIQAGRAAGLQRLINISSGAVYGPGDHPAYGARIDEGTAPADPNSIYGTTKFASERITRRLAELSALDFFSVRLSSIYGPWEVDSGARDTLSPLMQAALLARRGENAILPRREARDWTYSRHIAAALAALMATARRPHDLYHITSGALISTSDFCAHLAQVYPDFSFRLAAPGETATINLHGDFDRPPMAGDRLADTLGWRPPADSAADFADFTQWMGDYSDFWPAA